MTTPTSSTTSATSTMPQKNLCYFRYEPRPRGAMMGPWSWISTANDQVLPCARKRKPEGVIGFGRIKAASFLLPLLLLRQLHYFLYFDRVSSTKSKSRRRQGSTSAEGVNAWEPRLGSLRNKVSAFRFVEDLLHHQDRSHRWYSASMLCCTSQTKEAEGLLLGNDPAYITK